MSITSEYEKFYCGKNCFRWCGEYNCECMRLQKPFIPTLTEHMNQSEKIRLIREQDEFNPNNLKNLIDIAKNDPDNLVRAIARAKLEGRAISIIERLLKEIKHEPV